MKLPAVLVPPEQSLPPLRPTNAVFVLNDPRGVIGDLRWGSYREKRWKVLGKKRGKHEPIDYLHVCSLR